MSKLLIMALYSSLFIFMSTIQTMEKSEILEMAMQGKGDVFKIANVGPYIKSIIYGKLLEVDPKETQVLQCMDYTNSLFGKHEYSCWIDHFRDGEVFYVRRYKNLAEILRTYEALKKSYEGYDWKLPIITASALIGGIGLLLYQLSKKPLSFPRAAASAA